MLALLLTGAIQLLQPNEQFQHLIKLYVNEKYDLHTALADEPVLRTIVCGGYLICFLLAGCGKEKKTGNFMEIYNKG